MAETKQMQEGGSSISSSGSGEGKLELPWKAYAKVDAKHIYSINDCDCECIPVMVTVSGVREKQIGKQRAPMDVVVVLHVRRGKDYFNGPKNWRELLEKAMDTVAVSLHREDRLAVVPGASTLTPARRFLPPQLSTSDTSLVRAMEHAESILLGREHEDKMRRAGHIIVISNSNDDDMGSLLVPYRLRYVRHAFGFRDAHNARTMQSLCASIRNCTYAVLDDEQGQIAPAFFASIDGTITAASAVVVAAAAMPTEVKLKCDHKVLVAAIDTPGVRHFISYDKKVGVVWPPAHLTAESDFRFVVYLGNLALRSSDDDLLKLLSIEAKYSYYRGGGDGVSSSPTTTTVHKVAVQVVTSKNNNAHESKEVAAEMVRTGAVKIVAGILLAQEKTDGDWEQLHVAAQSLRRRWEGLEKTDCYREAHGHIVISGLSADMHEMEIRLHNNYLWHEYMLSWHSHQRWQVPIPRPFLDKQPTRNKHHLLVVDHVVARSPAAGRRGLLPVLVRVMAPEVGLAMVKRASVDLVVVVDAGYGAKDMQEKLDKRRELLSLTKELEEQRSNAIKTIVEYQNKLENKLGVVIYGKEVGGSAKRRWQQDAGGTSVQRLPIRVKRRVDLDKETQQLLQDIDQKRNEMKLLTNNIKAKLSEAEKIANEFEMVAYMARKRLDVITKAIELVQKKLSVEDRLAIICAQFPDTEPAAGRLLETMSARGQRQTTAKLQKLMGKLELSEAGWKIPAQNKPKLSKASHCREQSKKAMKLMRTCLNCTFNSSTPIPASAECPDTASMTVNWGDASGSTLLSRALIHAVKILDERREQEKDHRMGFVVVVSDRDDDSICSETLSRKYITHAFGFHEAHNMWAMYHIAKSCNGIYDNLNDESNKLTEGFVACINKITSTIAVDTKIDIKCSHSSVVSSADIESSSSSRFGLSWPSIGDSGKSCSIKAGALSAGTVASFVIKVDQVRENDELFTIHLEWAHPLGKTKDKDEVVVDKKAGAGGIDTSKDEGVLMKSIARVEAVKIVNEIAAPLYQDRMMVEAKLKELCKKCSSVAEAAGEDRLARATANMSDNLSMETRNLSYFKQIVAQTLSIMLSWLSYH